MSTSQRRPSTRSRSPQRRPRPRAWALPAPAIFMMAWGGNHFTPLLHMYETVGDYAPWQANLLLGMYVAGLIPGLLLASALSDRHGRKPLLCIGALATIAGSVILALGLETFVLLCIGRALAGVGVGVAMSVGTSWMKELSSPRFDPTADATAGARRPSLTLTLGFGIGAAITGALAQWGPAPTAFPFALHVALSVAALALLMKAPESLPRAQRTAGSLVQDLRVPSVGHRRFVRLILPAAPWVFAAAGVAYAIMPAVVNSQLGEWATLYATVLTVLTLGTGAVVQTQVPRINRCTRGRALPLGLALMTAGMILAAIAALLAAPILALAVAVLLGAAYGVCVVAGLIHVQSLATAQDLAGLTGVYYALTYTGFLLPTVLAALLPIAPYPLSLAVVASACALCLILVARESARPAE